MGQRNSEKAVHGHEKVQKQPSAPAVELQTESVQPASQNLWGTGELGSQAGGIARMAIPQQQAMLARIGQVQGNRHVQRLVQTMHQNKSRIQAKMQVSTPDDANEIEAEQVATQVMKLPATSSPDKEETGGNVQRTPAILHRQAEGAGGEVPAETSEKVDQLSSGGKQLPGEEAQFFGSRMGSDFSGVNIRADQQAADTAQELNARAFTVGNTIAFNKGEYQPGTAAGRHLLAHELTHVVQQGAAPASGGQPVARSIQQAPQLTPPQNEMTYPEAKKAIIEACSGPGTDEEAIYQAIRKCKDRSSLRNDPAVKSWLKGDLNDLELWKANLLLQYGDEAKYPKGLLKIWETIVGGFNKDKLLKELGKLTNDEQKQLKAIPGINSILKEELDGTNMQSLQDLAGKYTGALKNHEANVLLVRQTIKSMLTSFDPVEKNTAVWLSRLTSQNKTLNNLYILSLTHDSAARVAAHNQPDTMHAYFGADKLYPDISSNYDAHIDSDRNIKFVDKEWAGSHQNGKIFVYNPSAQLGLRATLVHEVQHDADHHNEEPSAKKPFKSPEESWTRYKTEFRAYWIANMHGFTNSVGGIAPFDNQRQKDIFDHLYSSRTYAKWLKPNYDNDTKVNGQSFKQLVHNYKKPEGVNLVNSTRIDDFFRRLNVCKKSDIDFTKSPLKELEEASKVLNANDRAYINSSEAAHLQQMARDHLENKTLKSIATTANGGTEPAWAKTITASASATVGKNHTKAGKPLKK